MAVCIYSVFVLPFDRLILGPRVLSIVHRIKKLKKWLRPNKRPQSQNNNNNVLWFCMGVKFGF